MFKRWLLLGVFSFLVLAGRIGNAQNLCPPGAASAKLICVIPQVYGANGLVLGAGPGQFDFASSSLKPVNSAIVSQAAILPVASPSSGITFAWDSEAKVFSPSTDSFGPIVSERGETIGKNKVFVGLDYQFFRFRTFDGMSLKSLPVVFTLPDNSTDIPGTTCSVNGFNTAECAFIRDVVKTNNRLDLKVHQFITVLTFGLTNRIDISAVIPISSVRMAMTSDTTIVNNSNSVFHVFDNRPGCNTALTNCLNQTFTKAAVASGIGDMILRVKGTAWKGERAALALGADIRVPTGDALNYLGAGTAGVKPFVAWSLSARVSPHVLIGYETNGSSVIAGDIATGSKERLPGELDYTGGVDIRVTKRLTAAVDLVGEQVFQAQRLRPTTFTELGACTQMYPGCTAPFLPANTDPALSQSAGTFSVTNVSVGGKYKPFSNLLITGNVLIKVNDSGLRSSVVPLIGVSYTF